MMVCRRRWRLLALTLVALTPALTLAAGSPSSASVSRLKTATGKDSAKARDEILTAAPSTPLDLDKYAADLAKELTPVLSDPANADARLNTAILFARLGSLATDKPLIAALTSSDPAVRYWGAKGLGGTIAATLKKVGAGPAVAALRAAAKTETSGVVMQEIMSALKTYESLDGVLDGLEKITDTMRGDIPDRGTLTAASEGLAWVQEKIGAAAAPLKTRAATIAARAASFTAQQHEAFAKFPPVPAPWADAAKNVVENSVKVLNRATGNTFLAGDLSGPAEMMLAVNNLVRALGRVTPPIPAPPKVGIASATSTAPAATAPTQ
jgi:hypothetical protein